MSPKNKDKNKNALNCLRDKLNQLMAAKSKQEKEIERINGEILKKEGKIKRLEERLMDLEKSDKKNIPNEDLCNLKKRIKAIESLVDDIKGKSYFLKEGTKLWEEKNHQEENLKKIVICNVPQRTDEDLKNTVIKIASYLNVKIGKADIKEAFRMKGISGKNAPIIVNFKHVQTKERIIIQKKKSPHNTEDDYK